MHRLGAEFIEDAYPEAIRARSVRRQVRSLCTPEPTPAATILCLTDRILGTKMTDIDMPIQEALETELGTERSGRLLIALDNYSNQPNAVKGAAKRPSDPEIEAAAHAVFAAATPDDIDLELDTIGMWGLLTLAARADVTILEVLPDHRKNSPKVASIRRAAIKHRKSLTDAADSAE